MKLVEVYTSIQGEGPNTGKPIQFVRFGGCNMRCPGWPCDTQFAIDPQFRKEWISNTPDEVLNQVQQWPERICMTGGEPLIQPNRDLEQFVFGLPSTYKIDLFTNGSQPLPPWAFQGRVQMMLDWKLSGSGEKPDPIIRKANVKQLRPQDGIKFVVKDLADLREAQIESDQFYSWGVQAQIWVGACWDQIEDKEIVEFMMRHKLNWRLNVQMHNHIWTPQERAR